MVKKPIIVPVEFRVNGADYKTIEQRESNNIAGPGYHSWITGAIPEVTLSVSPLRPLIYKKKAVEIYTLIFNGFCSILFGDNIRAYIERYTEEEGEPTGMIISGKEGHIIEYIERDFLRTEKVSKIEKFNLNGQVLGVFNGLKFEDYSV